MQANCLFLDRDWPLFVCVAVYFFKKRPPLVDCMATNVASLLYNRYSKCALQWWIQVTGPGTRLPLYCWPQMRPKGPKKKNF